MFKRLFIALVLTTFTACQDCDIEKEAFNPYPGGKLSEMSPE
jgi:hypothetical protein